MRELFEFLFPGSLTFSRSFGRVAIQISLSRSMAQTNAIIPIKPPKPPEEAILSFAVTYVTNIGGTCFLTKGSPTFHFASSNG